MKPSHYDYLIIGAGIIGAALATELSKRRPQARILVVEKESAPALHQTGRNSGVVHSGVYYTPGSLKAQFCREGLLRTKHFCQQHQIPLEERGKLLVATNEIETQRLQSLVQRAEQNQVLTQQLSRQELKQCEPAINGVAALRIPSTAIVDYGFITRVLLTQLENAGGTVFFNSAVVDAKKTNEIYQVQLSQQIVTTSRIIACGGLDSDRLARLLGIDPEVRIVPFRGEYFVLPDRHKKIVHHLIYPIPDPNLPFLGVHLTPMINGTITVGPNAVLALARENYERFSFNFPDAWDALSYIGLWKMLAKHPKATWNEFKSSISKKVYLSAVQKYCPAIEFQDLHTYHSANRAQAVRPDGSLVDDFLIKHHEGITVILNAPSPAATSALPIAKKLADDILFD